MTYIVYWTVYLGDQMPRNYIGSTTLEKHQSGYLGSVNSVEYKEIWKSEIINNRHLFRSYIMEIVNGDRDLALDRELAWQYRYQVAANPLFINRSYARKGFYGSTQSIQKGLITKEKKGVQHWSEESLKKAMETKIRHGTLRISPKRESILKGLETKKLRGTTSKDVAHKVVQTKRTKGLYAVSAESIQKSLDTKRKNGTLAPTPEAIAKGLETKKKNGTLNVRTPENIAKGIETTLARYGCRPWNTPEAIAKRVATRLANKALKEKTLALSRSSPGSPEAPHTP